MRPNHDAPLILVVEDDDSVATLLTRFLQHFGYRVCDTAASGDEALAISARCRPDLALLDLALDGDMDGFEIGDHLRSLFGVPVVYVTSYADAETLLRAGRGYLHKPFRSEDLRKVVERALHGTTSTVSSDFVR